MVVKDDGTGFSTGAGHTSGIGLRAMRHRAQLISAELRIQSRLGAGTTVECRVPMPPERTTSTGEALAEA